MKEITFPELCGVDNSGRQWGLSEYLTDIVFARVDLLVDDWCELIVELKPKLMPLRGKAQVGVKVKITDTHHRLLRERALPPENMQMAPEFSFAVAQCRLAIGRAVEAKEDASAASVSAPS